MRNVVLTGFMGTGKSSVGRMLADRLGFRFVDLDAEVVRSEGRSINTIFAESGEEAFRVLEAEHLQRLLLAQGIVLATGGGVVKNENNRRIMHSFGVVVNLTATVDAIWQRLAEDTERPLLRDDRSPERIEAMLAERERCYAEADVRIDTTGKSVESVVDEILLWLKKECVCGNSDSRTR